MPVPADVVWTVPDAVLAAVLAACLATAAALVAVRRGAPGHRRPLGAVPVALAVALAATVLTRGETVVRAAVLVLAVGLVAGVAAWPLAARQRRGGPGPRPGGIRDRIAPPDGRC